MTWISTHTILSAVFAGLVVQAVTACLYVLAGAVEWWMGEDESEGNAE